MKTFPAEETAWAGRLAARLRVLQADAAADAPDLRLDFLKEEIERALHDIGPARRGSHLDALAEQFPDFAPPRGGESEVALLSLPPEVLVADLIDTAPTLPAETLAAWGQRLAEAGFGNATAASAGPGGGAFDLPADTRARLGLAAAQETDPERAARLCGLLIDLTIALDQLAWSVWKQVAPQSIIRRDAGPDGEFRRLAGRYLAGDPEVVATQVSQTLDRSRHLIAGLLAAIGPAGGTFARNYLAKFSPEAIATAAAAGGGSFLSSAEQRNWRKYTEMFGQVSGAAIERELLNAIAQYAETAILGPNRPPAAPPPAGGMKEEG